MEKTDEIFCASGYVGDGRSTNIWSNPWLAQVRWVSFTTF